MCRSWPITSDDQEREEHSRKASAALTVAGWINGSFVEYYCKNILQYSRQEDKYYDEVSKIK